MNETPLLLVTGPHPFKPRLFSFHFEIVGTINIKGKIWECETLANQNLSEFL